MDYPETYKSNHSHHNHSHFHGSHDSQGHNCEHDHDFGHVVDTEITGHGVRKAATNFKHLVDKSRKKNNSLPKSPKPTEPRKKTSLSVPKMIPLKQSSFDSAASADSTSDTNRQKVAKLDTLQLNWSPQKASSEILLGVESPFIKPGSNSTSDSNHSKLKPSLSEDLWPECASNLQILHNGSISNSINVSDPKLGLGSKGRINSSKKPFLTSIDKFLHAHKRAKSSRKTSISSFTTENPRKSLPDTNHLLQLMEPSVSQKRQMFKSFKGRTAGPAISIGSEEASGNCVPNDLEENGDISENDELLAKPFESPRLISIQRSKPANVNVVQARPPLPILQPFVNNRASYTNHI